jgi:ATP synthase F1 complex assembly factor 1
VPKPLKGKGSFVSMYLTWQGPHCLVTLLEEYMRHQENASPHLTVTFYTELLQSKGLVLARGEISSQELNTQEAEALVRKLQWFYSDPIGQRIVESFNRGSPDYSFHEVLARCGIEDGV